MKKILVIGAQNIDLYAHSNSNFQLHDSNQSKIHLAFGGVGCNIATNLSLLGNQVNFLTVFGGDNFGQLAKQNLTKLKIDFKESHVVKEVGNSIYLGVMDKANDLFLGLNDMEILNSLNEAFFKDKFSYIDSFDFLVVDNNLSLEALQYILATFKHKKIIMDAVSANKAIKLQRLLPFINLLKLNLLELNALSDMATTVEKMNDLLKRGVTSVLLTNAGKEIIYQSKKTSIVTKPIFIEKIKNATGAGDAFLAGFINGLIQDKSAEDCINVAKKVAYACLQSSDATIKNNDVI